MHHAVKAPGRVLSTLREDGSRVKLRPRHSPGRFARHRGVVAYALIVLFVALPLVKIGGRPAFLIDLALRRIDLFGATFRPSDGATLMLLGLSIVLAVFLVTALWGRVWCGWGCPQTVYMEWVFRPVERFFEKRRLGALRFPVFAVLSVFVANVFLAYFVGAARLSTWVIESPGEHLGGFGVVAAVSALVFFDFAYFREYTCILACPYGRLQSVLLDRQSLIVGYDAARGEPRGKKRLAVIGQAADCVDCKACVATCPTGIDIRDGLQMECIGCAQCIDACDAIMKRLDRKPGLIRYSSQDELAGKPRHALRTRTVVYPALLALAVGLLVWQVGARPAAEVWVLRTAGAPFATLGDGRVSSQLQLRIENRGEAARAYTVIVENAPDVELMSPRSATSIAAGATQVLPVVAVSPAGGFRGGERAIVLRVADDAGWSRDVSTTLLGPEGGAP
jgi:cytochrome c oxidase accessory protein FixG